MNVPSLSWNLRGSVGLAISDRPAQFFRHEVDSNVSLCLPDTRRRLYVTLGKYLLEWMEKCLAYGTLTTPVLLNRAFLSWDYTWERWSNLHVTEKDRTPGTSPQSDVRSFLSLSTIRFVREAHVSTVILDTCRVTLGPNILVEAG